MGTSHLTDEEKEQILQEYDRTKIVAVTARRVGVSEQQVRHYLKKQDIELTGYRETACWKNRHLVREMAENGCSYSEIAREVGTNHHRVKEHFERYNLPYRFDQSIPENNSKWRGGERIDKDGYVLVLEHDHPNANRHGYVRKHRKVMSEDLGRPLKDHEVVHHIDGDKKNNHIDNLRLYSSNGEHLADELKGQIPNFSEEGLKRIPKGIARAAKAQGEDSRSE
jgi:transposase-like protein